MSHRSELGSFVLRCSAFFFDDTFHMECFSLLVGIILVRVHSILCIGLQPTRTFILAILLDFPFFFHYTIKTPLSK